MLIISILSNSLLIIAESVDVINNAYGIAIKILGWVFVTIFLIEYLLRILVVNSRKTYILSFFGIIDLLAILPAFLGIFLPGIRFLAVVRSLRLLRLFSVLKMGRYIEESSHLLRALKSSKAKITVFLFTIFFIIVVMGSFMYVIEGPQHGFTNIPESMYWAIVTVSTVGYGDISPQTVFGKFIASILMIIGYGILAVPTGIISYELASTSNGTASRTCPSCHTESYGENDQFCSKCGTQLVK